MRVLGVDPGLTRCGVGVVDGRTGNSATLIDVQVITTDSQWELGARLETIDRAITALIAEHRPDRLAVERVFSQVNVRTVMGTAQAAGICVLAAHRASVPITMYTPTEVKAAVTGSGRADKAQVGAMVARILRLTEVPRPADAADALALAITELWRGAGRRRIEAALAARR